MAVQSNDNRHRFAMKFVFRVDASLQIGMGHVMRCLTLAEELAQSGHQCTFVIRAHEGHPDRLIKGRGFHVVLMNVPSSIDTIPRNGGLEDYRSWLGVPWEQDAAETLPVLEHLKPDWLIVDHYALDARWERRMAPLVARTMVIDDLANREHQCDVLLDQNLGRSGSDYDLLVPEECLRLIGPAYALLRPEFARLRECSLARRTKPELGRILISMGGIDRTNVTGRVLSALADIDLPGDVEFDIVLGSSAPHLQEVRARAASMRYCSSVTIDANDMAERMCKADLSIGAAGSTSWERCCLGLPTFLVVTAPNQGSVAGALKSAGAVEIIDLESDWKSRLLCTFAGNRLSETLQKMSVNAASVTSGKGASLVTRTISECAFRNQ